MLKDYKHQLQQNCKQKHLFRDQMAEDHFVMHALYIDITTRLFYVFKDLHAIPHGSDDRSNMAKNIISLGEAGRMRKGGDDLVRHIPFLAIKDLSHPDIRVAYPGSQEIKEFEQLGLTIDGPDSWI